MADASAVAVAGAAKSIGSTLLTEAKYFYGVEDEVRALQSNLECMQQFLQDVDVNPNLLKQDGQLRILAHKMQQLAYQAEDTIDIYLVVVGSKIYNKNFLLKFVCRASPSYPMHMLRNEIEAIQQEIKVSMSRAERFRMSISTTSQPKGACVGSSYSRAVAENYVHLDGESVVGIGDDIFRLMKRLTGPQDAIHTYLVDVGSKIYNKNFLLKFVSLASHSYPIHMLRKEIEAIQQKINASMSGAEGFRMSISTTSQPKWACVESSYSKAVAENYIHLDDEFVVGIEDDISRLVKRLTGPQDDFQVLGIVGTGGAGKTILASQIYHHTKVQSSFPHRAFVSVSQQWSRLDLLQRISKEILDRSEIASSERELVTKFHDFMKDQRCLVVLDDIWKKEAWDDIYPIFPRTKNVKVILTTRIEGVPRYADTKCVLHEPRLLTNDQMWELFSKRAVEGRHGIENNNEFEKLGKLMLQKCQGLPLTVVTLAGILRTKQHLYEWERVNVSLRGKVLEEKGGSTYGVVEEMLELSFLDLSPDLKPLFLYLAIIPEDHKWSSELLIRMWIAEGFVPDDQTESHETLEEKGKLFVSELAQRYIIQVKKVDCRDEIELISINDLMREFCLKKASECQFLEYISSTHSYGKRSNKPRRVSIFSRDHCLEENSYLRTIVYRGLSDESGGGVLGKLESIHKNFKLLRVLKISNCVNKTLPSKIGNLIHLTYLSIQDTEITELPESVRNLRNLTILVFSTSPRRVLKIPNDLVGNMENLGVLVLWGSVKCNRIGLNSEKHKKLLRFSCDAGRWMKQELPLMHILTLRELRFNNVKKIEDMEAIHQLMSFLNGSLQTFYLAISYEGVSKELKFDTDKLIGMQPLHTLTLYGPLVNNGTIQFPPNLVSLHLNGSEIGEGVDLMGVLGHLSNLKYLFIGYEAYLGTQLRCTGGSFPQLESLHLSLADLEEWSMEDGAMSRLNRIVISGCDKLKRLPQGIRSITTLKELYVSHMPEEFCLRLGYKSDENAVAAVRTQGGEDSYIIQHIPSVKFDYIIQTSTAHYPAEESYSDSDVDDSIAAFKETTLKSGGDSLSNQTEHLNAHIPEVYIDEPTKQVQTAFKETTSKSGVSGGDSLSNQTEHLNAHIPEVYIDEKVIQSLDEPTKQVQTGNQHDPQTESCVFGGDSLSHQTERQSPISPDEVTQLTPPTQSEIVPMWKENQHKPHSVPADEHLPPTLLVGFETQGTDDNNGINKEEAKRLLFLFSEGYEFEKLMLIQLWMALGLLPDEPMEENGACYFENLVSEGYILCSVPNSLYKVNLEKLGIEDQSYVKLDSTRRNSGSSTETLHASVVCDEINSVVFQTIRGFKRLRTLLFLGSHGFRLQQVPRDLFLCFESLEALDLSGTHIKELPSSAGKMINLRYLDLSWTLLEVLPERIDRFRKLQTLKLEGCSRLRRLPDEMKGLIELRHLHLDVLRGLASFPEGMGALVNIHTLSAFPVGTKQGLEISELKYLNHITGSFCIAKIENVQSPDAAKEAFLNEKKKIKKLDLRWSHHKIECPMNESEGILQNLCPCPDVEEVQIVCYPGIELPDWIADVSFDKLASITLFECVNVSTLPSVGKLPWLASLELVSLNSLTKLDFKGVAGEYVAFPKLQTLSVDEMLNLETWAEAGEGDYPCIEELSIKDCPKLSRFPSVLYAPSLKHLKLSGCKSPVLEQDKTLPEFLEQLIVDDCPLMEDRCSKDGGQDWHKIQHVPTIWVNHFPIQPIEDTEYY